jgi:threonylcarbamoyladenosine tRNA methylthiotransferase MtaB
LREHDAITIHTDIEQATEAPSPSVSGFAGGLTRGFVQVQNGCDHACTYCVIPQGRGRSRSVPLETISVQTRLLLEKGYPEIALTGVDITSYGSDLLGQPSLGLMVKRLLMQVPELRRLRLSSLDPMEIDEDLWKLIESEPRLMPQLHLSLQAGDDMVLKRMKRRHTRRDIENLVSRARAARPDMVFGADVIAGFPTETDEMFENTYRLLEELDFTWLHVFPYSARKGTSAAKMPQVRVAVRKARAARLRGLGEKAVHRHIDGLVGQKIEVHVEQPFLGRTPSFAEVALLSPEEVGSVIRVEGLRREKGRLVAATEPLTKKNQAFTS